MTPSIHQFHSGSAMGDGVTNGMFYIQRLLSAAGFSSDVYAQYPAADLGDRVNPHTALVPNPDGTLLVHHSMGHDLTDWVLSRPERKILVYHNITPAEALPPDPVLRRYAKLGREQLGTFLPHMAGAIGVSAFNTAELRSAGYSGAETIELLVDLDVLRGRPYQMPDTHPEGRNTIEAHRTVLCVGRVCEHKCQHDLVLMARHLRDLSDEPFRILLVGGYDDGSAYVTRLRQMIAAHHLQGIVRLVGKVPDPELYGWYRSADVLVSMSEHEGFCMPVVEAMAFDLPVIAFNSGNMKDTLGGAGLLVERKHHKELAGLVLHVVRDRSLRRQLVLAGQARLADLEPALLQRRLLDFLARQGIPLPEPADTLVVPPRVAWRVEGPCETSYSLAVVNRELAFALERATPGRVGVRAMEGTGTYVVDEAAADGIPGLRTLMERGGHQGRPTVVLRNLYPPRVHDSNGLLNILQIAWEESRFPEAWVSSFNRSLDAVAVPSRYVRKVLIDAGVTVPIRVSGHGIEHIHGLASERWTEDLGKRFRFLHVSSCFPRKGFDALLKAYGRAFTASDDVTLVVKTFPNPHNTVEHQIAELRARLGRACPDIVLINRDLPAAQVRGIYEGCHVLVAPSRGEGFGLPIAEAMAMGLAVVTTAHSGQMDFCTPDNSWLVDYQLEPAQSHHGLAYSVWAEPDVEALAARLREVFDAPASERQARAERGRADVLNGLRWDRCADVLRDLAQDLAIQPPARTCTRVGWVSTFNSRCGIATYSEFLTGALPRGSIDLTILANHEPIVDADPTNLVRSWHNRDNPDLKQTLYEVVRRGLEVVVIQFNYGFYDLVHLGGFIDELKDRGIVVVVMFHATGDVLEQGRVRFSLRQILPALRRCDRLLVHSIKDLNAMRVMGLVDNVMLFPHGAIRRPETPATVVRERLGLQGYGPIIGMYGFLLPNKGVVETIQAMPRILERHPNALLMLVNALYPNPVSDETLARCARAIADLRLQERVVLVTDFLDHEESLMLLEAADVLVFPYQHSNESASGAVKVGLAANRPVLCSPLGIFNDLSDIVSFLPGIGSEDIAAGIRGFLEDPERAGAAMQRQKEWLAVHDWNRLGEWLGNLIRSLVINAPPRPDPAAPAVARTAEMV